MNQKALVLDYVNDGTLKNHNADELYSIDYNNLESTASHLPENYFLLIIDPGIIDDEIIKEIIERIEMSNTYKKINVEIRRTLYFGNISIIKEYRIYRSYYADLNATMILNMSLLSINIKNIECPCIVDCICGDISQDENLNIIYSFKPLTDPDAKHKAFLMDHRKHLVKPATKTVQTNNNNNQN